MTLFEKVPLLKMRPMTSQKDFEFTSPLSQQEALQRLKQHAELRRRGGFCGSVDGTQFILYHFVGPDPTHSADDPQLSGYIQPEGNGCRVFARIKLDEMTDLYLWFGIFCLVCGVIGLCATYINPKMAATALSLAGWGWTRLILPVGQIVLMAFVGWRMWMKFAKKGMPDAINQFRCLLEEEPMVEDL
ncbi:MAG: hypothetical protein ACKVUS_01290 [Saprospiraceae bacterium]